MKLVSTGIAALGIVLCASGPVFAQAAAGGGQQGGGGGQRGGRGAASLATLPIAALDAVVTLTAEQKTKITALQETYKTDAAAAQGDRQKMGEVRTKANADIKAVLTSDQATKITAELPVISLLGRTGAVPTSVIGTVKLTADQWTKINTAAKAAAEKLAAIAQEDRREKSPPINDEFKAAVTALLTADQKAIVEKAPKPQGRPGGAAPGAPGAPTV